MTYDEFKERLIARHGINRVHFREVGKHGWRSVEDILDRKPGSQPGPHYCDASPIPATQYLLGSYDFNTGIARFFSNSGKET